MENIISAIFNNGWTTSAAIGIVGIVLNLFLKKFISTEALVKIGKSICDFFEAIGITITLGLSKLPYLNILWNNTIEPYVILILDVALKNMLTGIIKGMETDNKSTKEKK